MPGDPRRLALTWGDWTVFGLALGLWLAETLFLGSDTVSGFLDTLRSVARDFSDARPPILLEVVMAPAFFWLIAAVPPLMLAAALMPPAMPHRWRRRTIRLAGGLVVAVAVLLALGCVSALLDVPMNVKT